VSQRNEKLSKEKKGKKPIEFEFKLGGKLDKKKNIKNRGRLLSKKTWRDHRNNVFKEWGTESSPMKKIWRERIN